MDLLSVLPDFSIKPYAHILPPLERSKINTVDLISLDTLEIAKRAHVPPADVRRLANHVVKALHHDVGFEEVPAPSQDDPSCSLNLDVPLIPGPRTRLDLSQWCAISTLDPALDALLDGGLPIGYVSEVTGESGSGKTQFLLSLLLAVQLPPPRGAGKSAIYISTEAPLATTRLSQLLESHPYLSGLERRGHAPSLERILSINAMDLESQEHILNYQLPVAIKRYNVGLVVIDSITSNYRAEHTSHNLSGLSTRSGELAKLGQMLRNLAVNEGVAVVVANQVSDRFEGGEGSSLFSRLARPPAGEGAVPFSSPATQQLREYYSTPDREPGSASPLPRASRPLDPGNIELSQRTLAVPASTPAFPSSSPNPTQEDAQQQQQQQQQQFDGSYLVSNPVRNEILSLQHQQRFFTGWGDSIPVFHRSTPKTPTLGLVWATQVACRIALKKEDRTDFAEDTGTETGAETETLIARSQEPPATTADEHELPASGADGAPITAQPSTDKLASSAAKESSDHQVSASQRVERTVRRSMRLVFSPWAGGSGGDQSEVEFEIWGGGLRSVGE